MLSDTLDNYATFGPLFVSIKVSDYISLSNLFFTQKRPACAVCMSPLQASKPLYKPRLAHRKSKLLQTGRQKAKCCSEQRTSCHFNHFYLALFPRGIMWKAVVLAVCLLVAGVQPMDDPTYGVKLCGREFIRAVIFTCGGSRWRRSITSAGERLKVLFLIATITVLVMSQGFIWWVCMWLDLGTKTYLFIKWYQSFSQFIMIFWISLDPGELILCSWWRKKSYVLLSADCHRSNYIFIECR